MAFGIDDALAIAGVGSAISGLFGADAAKTGASQQAAAANKATDATLSMFNTQNSQQAPYRNLGTSALRSIGQGLGLGASASSGGVDPSVEASIQKMVADKWWDPQYADTMRSLIQSGPNANWDVAGLGRDLSEKGSLNPNVWQKYANPNATTSDNVNGISLGQFTKPFTLTDLTQNLDPSYEFIKGQGIGAATNAGNAAGGAGGGNTMKGIVDYATNFAKTGAQTAFNIWSGNQTNIINRLMAAAGLGQTANAQSTTLAGSAIPAISQSTQAAGTAQAGGTIGAANALTGGANNALGWYTLGNFMKPSAMEPGPG